MPILKILPNQPYSIALKYSGATEKPGKWGMQFQYVLSDGSILYLPPIAHAEIQGLKPAPLEPFTLTKRIDQGNAAVWSVERIQQPIHPANGQPKPMPARTIQSAIPIPPSLTTPQSIELFLQLCAVIQIAKAAEEFGKSIGRETRFESADIRAMAISGFIDKQSRRAA